MSFFLYTFAAQKINILTDETFIPNCIIVLDDAVSRFSTGTYREVDD